MLKLKFGYTADKDAIPTTFIDNDGKHLLTFYRPKDGSPFNVPDNVVVLSDTESPAVDVFTVTAAEVTAVNQFIIAIATSPSLNYVVAASVYQNYSNPMDTLNTFNPNGTVALGTNLNYTHDVTLTLYRFTNGFTDWSEVSERIIPDVYFLPRLFVLTWSKLSNRYFTVLYPTGITSNVNTPTPLAIEVSDSHSPTLAIAAENRSSVIFGNRAVLFTLCNEYYLAISGSAVNLNPLPVSIPVAAFVPMVPNGVVVYKVEFCTMSITEVDFRRLSVPSRMIDVRVCGEEAQFANTTEQPITRKQDLGVKATIYQKPYLPGVSVSLYEEEDKSSVQLLKFKCGKITLVETLVFGVPGSYAVAFIPKTKFLLVSISYPNTNSYDQMIMLKVSRKECSEKYLTIVQSDRPLAHRSVLSVSREKGYVVASGTYIEDTGLNSIQLLQLNP